MLHHSHCLAPQGASQILAQKFNTRNMHIFHCSAPCTPLQREVAAKPSPRVLRAPRAAQPTSRVDERRLCRCHGASFRFSNNAGDTRIRASLPMGACSGHDCSSPAVTNCLCGRHSHMHFRLSSRRNLILWTSNTACYRMRQRVRNSPGALPARLKICASAQLNVHGLVFRSAAYFLSAAGPS